MPNSCLPCRPPNDTAGGRAIPRDFAYIDGHLPDGDTLPLMRLATAAQLAAGLRPVPCQRGGYQDRVLPTGFIAGTLEEALDCAAASTSTTRDPEELTPLTT